MPNPNQANLPVTKREKELLDYAKRQYEQETDGRNDWGEFVMLGTLALLAGIGIGVALAQKRDSNVVVVSCPNCKAELDILLAGERIPIAERYGCPHCHEQFIVQFKSGT